MNGKSLTKEDTVILKGIAISFMLFLHLFNPPQNVDLCINFLYIGEQPLVLLLSKFTHICVPMYLFLSGYGLYISSQEGITKSSWKRIISLWLNYLIILFVFVGIGVFVNPEKYPGSFFDLILNITTWSYSYNGEWWFLFPYFILVLLSIPLFRLLTKINSLISFVLLGAIYTLTYIIIYYNQNYLVSHPVFYQPVLILNVLFSFGLGALFAKEKVFIKIKNYLSIYLSCILILLLIIIRMALPVAIFNPFFAVLFIMLFSITKRITIVDRILKLLGKHSTNVWLIHSFFCYHLFKNFIYSFKFPILIFLVLLLLSLASSCIINLIYKPVNTYVAKWIN